MQFDILAHPAMAMAIVLALAFTGALAGTMAGLFGVGGGIITVPILSGILELIGTTHDTAVHIAIATSLATIIPTSWASLRAHAKHDAVDRDMLRRWAPMVAIGAVLGSLIAGVLHGKLLSLIFGVFVVIISMRFIQSPRTGGQPVVTPPLLQRVMGFGIGSISAMLGIGGGVLGVAALSHCGLTLQRAIGTASNFGFMIAVPGTIIYLLTPETEAVPFGTIGQVHPLALLLLAPSAMLCAPVGARLAHTLNVNQLRIGFAVFLFILGGKMLLSGLA